MDLSHSSDSVSIVSVVANGQTESGRGGDEAAGATSSELLLFLFGLLQSGDAVQTACFPQKWFPSLLR